MSDRRNGEPPNPVRLGLRLAAQRRQRLSPSRLLPAGFGMSFELLLARELYLALDNPDRYRNRLLGVRGIRITGEKLYKVADLKP